MNRRTLQSLAGLLATRNRIAREITALVGRPAQIGHLGEFIASQVFDIALETSAANKGFDGRFMSGLFSGRTVNVKWYGKKEGLIDLGLDSLPDFYLVFTGPAGVATTSRGEDRPLLIESAYVFDARELVDALTRRGLKIGTATSVAKEYWDTAQIYPASGGAPLMLTTEQRDALSLFGSGQQGAQHS